MVREIKVGMLGAGFMGRAHTNAYNQMPQFFYPPPAVPVKTVLCESDTPKGEDFIQQWGWNRLEADWHNLMSSGEIDLFDNAGPNDMHYEPDFSCG